MGYPRGVTVSKPAIQEVQLRRESLNQQHVFVLDTYARIYIWCGNCASKSDLLAATAFAESKQSQRGWWVGEGVGGWATKVTFDIDDQFWLLLQDKTMEMVPVPFKPALYLVSKEGNDNYLKGFLKEMPLSRASLNEDDVFVLDSGLKVYVWIGEHASHFEKINANMYADHEESKRGSDPATVTHDVDDTFWELLDGQSPICEDAFSPTEIRESTFSPMEIRESPFNPMEIRKSASKPDEIEIRLDWLPAL